MKLYRLLFTLWGISMAIWACSEDNKNGISPQNKTDGEQFIPLNNGFNFTPQTPDADKPLTITFKASKDSPLYGYTGDAYLHIGIVNNGVWTLVPSEWDKNIDKCKFVKKGDNVWAISLMPSLREWFNTNDAIHQLGIIIRSADGTKKGVLSDTFIDVADKQQPEFLVAAPIMKKMSAGTQYGINKDLANRSVTFALYDQDKDGNRMDYAYLLGDFNEWKPANNPSSQMYRDEEAKCWWITISGLDPNKEYAFQYYVGKKQGTAMRLADPYAEKILDPENDKYISEQTYPSNLLHYPKGGVGIVSVVKLQNDSYKWAVNDYKIDNPSNLIIYELLIRDFTEAGNVEAVIGKLDYIKKLGVNAVELMPVQEFDGNDSWGYNPCFYFALDKAYGTPLMYKKLVDECHKRGIAVILDVVYNHATANNPMARLYFENGKPASNNPWFNMDAPHPYGMFCDFNHESELTRNFIKRNLTYFLDEYHIDGFRFDMTKGFTNKHTDERSANDLDRSRVNILKDYYQAIKKKNPNAVMICEHLVGIEEESILSKMGIQLWHNMNNAYCQSAMGWKENSAFNYLSTRNTTMKEGGWIGYMESHDEERTGYKQTQWGNGVLKSDLPSRMKQLETNASMFFTIAGPKMIWQFGELGYDYSIDLNGRTGRKPIKWDYFHDKNRKELYMTYANLIQLRHRVPELFTDKSIREWRASDNDWDDGRYLLLETIDGKKLVVIANFGSNVIKKNGILPGKAQWFSYPNFDSGEVLDEHSVITVQPHSFRLWVNKPSK